MAGAPAMGLHGPHAHFKGEFRRLWTRNFFFSQKWRRRLWGLTTFGLFHNLQERMAQLPDDFDCVFLFRGEAYKIP